MLASGGGDERDTSSAAILFCFTAGTFIPHASSFLQIGGGACGHPTAPFARPGVCTRASYGVTGSEGREGANGVGRGMGGGIGDGVGNGDTASRVSIYLYCQPPLGQSRVYSRSRIDVPMGFTAESSSAQGH